MKWWSSVRSTFRDEPRLWVSVAFLAVAAALGALALSTLGDEGAALGWAGLASGFLTAGLVDFFGLLEGRRRRLEADQRLTPIRTAIVYHLNSQRQDLLETVQTLFPVEGDPTRWAQMLRTHDWVVPAGAATDLYPPQPVAERLAPFRPAIRNRQEHLEALSASGILTAEVAAMSSVVLRGMWLGAIDALRHFPSTDIRGVAPLAADMLDELLAIDLPEPPPIQEVPPR
ncbi:hypothetical protein C5B94_09130 [Clavibacter michiganensis]|uniref:hypothetical protein n=1 Tax=Clavibacter michiganensis TaxID=28447 RepID=UPI000D481953|nr:hypothetical protein [Clavibacter michiganensis]PPF53918.1 hypothetical protein C5B94_09130 [Clavibacter michiganensis]